MPNFNENDSVWKSVYNLCIYKITETEINKLQNGLWKKKRKRKK